MKLRRILEAQYKGKIHDPKNFVKDELIKFITTKQPSDLTGQANTATFKHEWFSVDASGRMTWNWNDPSYPAELIAKHYGLVLSDGILDHLTRLVLQSKQIKAFKIKFKEDLNISGEMTKKLTRRIGEIDEEITKLTQLRNKHQTKLDDIRDKHES